MTNFFRLVTICIFLTTTSNLYSQHNYNKVDEKNILINGKISFSGEKKKILKALGKADKIEKTQPECGAYAEYDTSVKFQYYTKSYITYLTYKQQADFSEIVFKKDTTNFVVFKQLKISHKTTVDDLKKAFPNSYIEYKKEKSGTFRLLFNIKDCDDQIHIFIKNNKVVSMDYWTPC